MMFCYFVCGSLREIRPPFTVFCCCIMLYSSHYSLHGNVATIREVEIAFIGMVKLLIVTVIIFLNK